jgi:hypothetical protein
MADRAAIEAEKMVVLALHRAFTAAAPSSAMVGGTPEDAVKSWFPTTLDGGFKLRRVVSIFMKDLASQGLIVSKPSRGKF